MNGLDFEFKDECHDQTQVWLRMAEAHALRTRRLVSSSFHCFRLFVCYITVCLCSFGRLFT